VLLLELSEIGDSVDAVPLLGVGLHDPDTIDPAGWDADPCIAPPVKVSD
jgi:hypothetical protein